VVGLKGSILKRGDYVAKARRMNDEKIMFQCPGCGHAHLVDERWDFNGDFDMPTFHPSVLVSKDDPKRRCHSFVTDGKIRFLAGKECHHDLAGEVVELPDL